MTLTERNANKNLIMLINTENQDNGQSCEVNCAHPGDVR